MKHLHNDRQWQTLPFVSGGSAWQTDLIKVDIDMSGRNSSEVTETG